MKNNELSLNKKIADLEEKLAKSEAELKSFIEEFDK
jgi:hypothetical protein